MALLAHPPQTNAPLDADSTKATASTQQSAPLPPPKPARDSKDEHAVPTVMTAPTVKSAGSLPEHSVAVSVSAHDGGMESFSASEAMLCEELAKSGELQTVHLALGLFISDFVFFALFL